MAVFVNVPFTGADGTEISAYDASFTRHSSYTTNSEILTNRVIQSASGTSCYYHSGTPANADYTVSADLYTYTNLNRTGVAGRIDTAANTMYQFRHDSGNWNMWAIVAGSFTQLGSNSADTLSAADTRSFQLKMVGSSITGLVGGSPVIGPITNTSITAKGKAGFRCNGTTSTAGKALDNLVAEDIVSGGNPWYYYAQQ